MKIIVTGGAGFVGSHLCEALVERGDEVTVIDNLSTGKLSNLSTVSGKFYLWKTDIAYELRDIGDLESLNNIAKLEGTEIIIHLAALPRIGRSVDNPIETHNANVNGTLNILQLARELKVKKFIFGSSSSVYGTQTILPLYENLSPNPESPYATQKLIGEEYCKIYKKVYGLNTLILRFFNVYGARMPQEGAYKLVMPIWLEQMKKGQKLTIYGDGEQTRDFTYIDDVVKGIIASIGKDSDLPINLCTNVETSINELAELFLKGTKLVVEYVKNPRKEEKRKVGSNTRANEILGWKPYVSIVEGIERLKNEYL